MSPTRGGERTCSTTAASEEGTACALLIETRAAIGNIEEIRKVEGIDCLTIAPFDLSTELGVSGHLDAPGLVEAITRAERVIGEAGIAPGGAALTQEQTHRLVKKGYRLLWHAFDVLVLKQFVLADGAMAIHLTHSCFRLHGPPRECPGR